MVKIVNTYVLEILPKKKEKVEAEAKYEDQNDQILQTMRPQIQESINPMLFKHRENNLQVYYRKFLKTKDKEKTLIQTRGKRHLNVLGLSQPDNSDTIAEYPGETHPGQYYLWQASTDIAHPKANVVAEPALKVLNDCKTHLSENHQGTWERQGLLLTSRGGYTACPLPHKKLPIERESMNLGFCFIEGEGRVPGFSQIHSLLVNLKPKSIN